MFTNDLFRWKKPGKKFFIVQIPRNVSPVSLGFKIFFSSFFKNENAKKCKYADVRFQNLVTRAKPVVASERSEVAPVGCQCSVDIHYRLWGWFAEFLVKIYLRIFAVRDFNTIMHTPHVCKVKMRASRREIAEMILEILRRYMHNSITPHV